MLYQVGPHSDLKTNDMGSITPGRLYALFGPVRHVPERACGSESDAFQS